MASKIIKNVYIKDFYTLVGPMEQNSFLENYDLSFDDYYYGEKTFLKAEIKMQQVVVDRLFLKNHVVPSQIDFIIGADLNNQICVSNYHASNYLIPYLGLYSACASFCEQLIIGSALLQAKFAKNIVTVISAHNLNAEKQFRYPVEYGAIKKLTTTFTTTGAVSTILTTEISKIKVESYTVGKAINMNINDANNMGAIMAPAAALTLNTHLEDLKRNATYYDLILTGDLGKVGKELFLEYLDQVYNIHLKNYMDAGSEIYTNKQDVCAGGSGPALLPLFLFDKILESKKYKKILLLATGSLQSVELTNQKMGIPGICHAISLEVLS